MEIVSKTQWVGWFKGMGSAGVMLQNVITSITPFIIAALAIWMVFLIVRNAGELSQATSAEARKEAKTKLGHLSIGIVLIIVLPSIALAIMNTVGKTSQVTTSPGTAATVTSSLNSFMIIQPQNIFR